LKPKNKDYRSEIRNPKSKIDWPPHFAEGKPALC